MRSHVDGGHGNCDLAPFPQLGQRLGLEFVFERFSQRLVTSRKISRSVPELPQEIQPWCARDFLGKDCCTVLSIKLLHAVRPNPRSQRASDDCARAGTYDEIERLADV